MGPKLSISSCETPKTPVTTAGRVGRAICKTVDICVSLFIFVFIVWYGVSVVRDWMYQRQVREIFEKHTNTTEAWMEVSKLKFNRSEIFFNF